MRAPKSAQHPLPGSLLAAIVNAGMHQRAQGETTVALQHKPTAPHHSTEDALRVLETVARHTSGVTDTEIARESGIGTERLTTLLRMLRREAYVEQTADGAYVTQYADSPAAPRVNEWVDFRVSAHATAVGKSLLTQLDHAGRRDHLARHRMARLTSRTITSDKLLLSRLESQPATVPVLDLQEYAVGTVCAAVPITAGSAVGCLALSLPVEHAHRLRRAADELNRSAAPVLLSLAI